MDKLAVLDPLQSVRSVIKQLGIDMQWQRVYRVNFLTECCELNKLDPIVNCEYIRDGRDEMETLIVVRWSLNYSSMQGVARV